MRNLKNMRGSSFVELSFSFPILFLILVGGLEVLRVSYQYIAVQVVADRAVEIMRNSPCNNSCELVNDRVRSKVDNLAKQLIVADGRTTICFSPQGAGDCIKSGDSISHPGGNITRVGGSRRLFTVRIRKEVPVFFGIKSVVLNAIGVGTHETIS